VRMKTPRKVERPINSQRALFSRDRNTREAAARKAGEHNAGRVFLLEKLWREEEFRVRAACLRSC